MLKLAQNNNTIMIDEVRLTNKLMCIAIQTLPENDLNNQKNSDLVIEILFLIW